MANDLLMIHCACGAHKTLAKYWAYDYEVCVDPKDLGLWLTEHGMCEGNFQTGMNVAMFKLIGELDLHRYNQRRAANPP